MPKLTGFEFARKINSIDKSTKIILMSAFHLTKEEFDEVRPSTRVDVFIKKPIGMTKLRDHLSVLLGNYKEGRWSLLSSYIGSATTTSIIFMLQDSLPVFA
jgi:YesN/AraC family two-component response regulator